ncbi:MAG TPA: hypothetical protein VD886_17270 [Herpetosiphonaceae bacterium]|nr:hypothetical protein [Herpetosiphonaceae bacterium]
MNTDLIVLLPANADGCCSPSEQESCCGPADSDAGSCGCGC